MIVQLLLYLLFQSTALLIAAFATFGCMVLLAWFKYLIAYRVDSRALRTDGKTLKSQIMFLTIPWKIKLFPG